MMSPQTIRQGFWNRLERVNMAGMHELKIGPEYTRDTCAGTEPFEVCRDDRGHLTGNYSIPREYVQQGASGGYTGREIRVTVMYISRGSRYIRPGYMVTGIRKMDEK